MKRYFIAIGLLALVLAAPLFADTSEFYPVKVEVIKINAHADGYQVIYEKGNVGTAVVYIPSAWFVPGGKAELVRANDPAYPYLVVFYKKGVFDHLRLYAQVSYTDPTWGVLSPSEGVGKFNVQDVKLEF
jgi:hypothetical protein